MGAPESYSIAEIAAMFGVSDMLIYARIREWGIPMRSKQLKRAAKWLGADELRRLYCDEFQDWKNAKEAWEEALLPTLLDNNGRALITGTPNVSVEGVNGAC
jgi:transposase